MIDTNLESCESGAYIRRSTFQQENKHQYTALRDWFADHDIDLGDVKIYSETASGASRNRDELRQLMDDIEAGELKHVVVWELSRIAREGRLAQEFFDLCEDHGVTVHVTSGSLRRIEPDGSNRFVADILAAVYAEERRTLIRRTEYGLERAREEEKWVGSPPLGFTTDANGRLTARLDEYRPEDNLDIELYNEDGVFVEEHDDYEVLYDEDGAEVNLEDLPEPKDSFFAIRDALTRLEQGESQRAIARDLHASRNGIVRVWRDETKCARYLQLKAEDDRVDAALEPLREDLDVVEGTVPEDEPDVEELIYRVEELEKELRGNSGERE